MKKHTFDDLPLDVREAAMTMPPKFRAQYIERKLAELDKKAKKAPTRYAEGFEPRISAKPKPKGGM